MALERFGDGDESTTDKFDYARAMAATTITEFDDAFTAKIYGFDGVWDYYEKTSSIHSLNRIAVPTFILNATDDPFFDPTVWPMEKTTIIMQPWHHPSNCCAPTLAVTLAFVSTKWPIPTMTDWCGKNTTTTLRRPGRPSSWRGLSRMWSGIRGRNGFGGSATNAPFTSARPFFALPIFGKNRVNTNILDLGFFRALQSAYFKLKGAGTMTSWSPTS